MIFFFITPEIGRKSQSGPHFSESNQKHQSQFQIMTPHSSNPDVIDLVWMSPKFATESLEWSQQKNLYLHFIMFILGLWKWEHFRF